MNDAVPADKADAGQTQGLPEGIALTALHPVFREQPHQILDALRAAAPVHRDVEFDRIFLTRYEDVRAIVNDRTLSVDPRKGCPAPHRPNFREMEDYEPSMLVLDDPDHKRLRSLVTQAFNARAVEAARPRIRAIAERLLDGIGGALSFDVIDVLASPLPTIVIAEMLGVDPGDQASFKRWSDALIQSFNPRLYARAGGGAGARQAKPEGLPWADRRAAAGRAHRRPDQRACQRRGSGRAADHA